MTRVWLAFPLAAIAAAVAIETLSGAAVLPACDADNGGIKLPPGFCATVIAEGISYARHIAIADNGDIYVGSRNGGPARGRAGAEPAAVQPGVVAMRDSNGDGKMDVTETFGDKSTNGVVLHNGYLYIGHTTGIERFKMTAGQLKPAGAAETIVEGLPPSNPHQDKGIAFDGRGGVYINVGAPSNTCQGTITNGVFQSRDRAPGVSGVDPCPLLETAGGIWKFDENKLHQKQSDGTRYATGMRQMPGIAWQNGALYAAMNGRDQIDVNWPALFTAADNDTRPSEMLYKVDPNSNFGWPYCFHDFIANKLLLNPEYGGDGKTVGRCNEFKEPIATYPPHWAPVDLMFYSGTMFPQQYRGGAFIAFHGSWNRTAGPQNGYVVVFQPFAGDKPSGKFQVFADGFEGPTPPRAQNNAMYRPDGVGQGPDGSLYITDSVKGRVWRVSYR
jgi:glucose/arabinose dehydrogenase